MSKYPDPLGPIDHENLYQYVYNNPLKYHDPTGCSFWGYVLGLGEVVAGGAIMAGGLGLEVVTLEGNWLNPETDERLHPDLWHPDPKGPHWGYIDPNGTPYDLFPDGSWQ